MIRYLWFTLAIILVLTLSIPHAISKEREVVQLEPLWITTQLRELNADRVALSLCGEELHSCENARDMLKKTATLCPNVLLAIIDVDKYKGTPRDLYDAVDPKLILLKKFKNDSALHYLHITADIHEYTFAHVMCPEASNIIGNAREMLKMPWPK